MTVPQIIRLDGLENAITGMGHTTYDPTTADSLFTSFSVLTREAQNEYVRKYGLLRKCVYNIPNASVSQWGKPTLAEGNPKLITELEAMLKKMPVTILAGQLMWGSSTGLRGGIAKTGVKHAIHQMACFAFKSGNGAIVMDVDDGQSIDQPIDYKRIKSVKRLWAASRWRVVPYLWRTDDSGSFSHYQNRDTGALIHRSRVLWIPGVPIDPDSDIFWTNEGCDLSILEPIVDAFSMYYSAIRGANRMIVDFDVIVHKIKDLMPNLKNGGIAYENAIKQRLRVNAKGRSVYRGMVIDKENEEIAHDTRQTGGYSDLLQVLKEHLLANTDYPPAVLFGEFSSGLDASGKSQEEKQLWNETVGGFQSSYLTDLLLADTDDHKGLLPILCLAKDGPFKGKIPEGLDWEWNPVYIPTREENAEFELSRSQIIQGYAALDPRILASGILELGQSPLVTLTKEYQDQLQKEAELKEPPGGEAAADESAGGEELPPEDQPLPEEELPPEEDAAQTDDENIDLGEFDQFIQDSADRPMRIPRFHGFELGITHQPFTKRFNKVLPVAYGHIRRTRGEDGMALDCYVGPFLDSDYVAKVKQLKQDGSFDEWKFFIGFKPQTPLVDIQDLYLAVMPTDLFGGVFPSSLTELEQYRVKEETRADAASPMRVKETARKALKSYRAMNKAQRKGAGIKGIHVAIATNLSQGNTLSNQQKREMQRVLKTVKAGPLFNLMGGEDQAKRVKLRMDADDEPDDSEFDELATVTDDDVLVILDDIIDQA